MGRAIAGGRAVPPWLRQLAQRRLVIRYAAPSYAHVRGVTDKDQLAAGSAPPIWDARASSAVADEDAEEEA